MICLLSVISGIISALFISLLPKKKHNQQRKNLGTNSMSIGLSSIIYMLSAVCFAKMASSDVKLGVRTCITVTF